MINRDRYLQKLINKKDNGVVKVITGIRRCGKSYLLFNIYHQYLNSIGINDDHIIELALDDDQNIRYRNPLELGEYIRNLIVDKDKMYYVFIDEIQKVADIPNPYLPNSDEKIGFVDVILGLMKIKNIDLYVTGSNSKMLSSDILTEFRGKGDEVRIYPLSYHEFYNAYGDDKRNAWRDYFTFGGMPFIMSQKTTSDKVSYLTSLFDKIYLDDIMNRNNIIKDKSILDDLLDIISSSVGSLTNPIKIQKTFESEKKKNITDDTIAKYLEYFNDAFLISKARRYDVKGRKYIASPFKYYYTDIGLRNARLGFRQQEETHIMENIIYNELIIRGVNVDVGIVTTYAKDKSGKSNRVQREIDFVANNGSNRVYIQSAFAIPNENKRIQETASLNSMKDSFGKVVIVKDNINPWRDEKGILYIGIEDFLLDDNAINL
ncbi:MAG: ATP-binding protein [Clostridiales bacterium]|nr:ATP-binding protein [Clostridiales bacterium]